MSTKTYTTGIPCIHGHACPRYVSDRGCVECKRIGKAERLKSNPEKVRAVSRAYSRAYASDPQHQAHAKAYRVANREKLRARSKAWAQANPARHRANHEKWKTAHPEKMQAFIAEWNKANRERLSAYSRKWYKANPERSRDAHATWIKAHPGYDDAKKAQRRAQKVAAGGRGVTPEQWKQTLAESLGICVYCNKRRTLSVDHIDPLNRGGAHDIENVATACGPCNSSKHDTPLLVWLARRAA